MTSRAQPNQSDMPSRSIQTCRTEPIHVDDPVHSAQTYQAEPCRHAIPNHADNPNQATPDRHTLPARAGQTLHSFPFRTAPFPADVPRPAKPLPADKPNHSTPAQTTWTEPKGDPMKNSIRIQENHTNLKNAPCCDLPGSRPKGRLVWCRWKCGSTTRNLSKIGDICWRDRENAWR